MHQAAKPTFASTGSGRRPISVLCAAMLAASIAGTAHAAPPAKVGSCDRSTITSVGTRFGHPLKAPASGGMDEGTSVVLENGVIGISYAFVPEVMGSRPGDPVSTCLVSLPKNCPKGDDRGKMYKTTNLRTQQSWTLPDSQHFCGGA